MKTILVLLILGLGIQQASAQALFSTRYQQLSQNSGSIAGSDEAGDKFGHALAAGDFDGDGAKDLAIGTPGESVGTVKGAGAVRILYGAPRLLSVTRTQYFDQNSTGIFDSAEPGDEFGSALAAGDFNGDGVDDLAIGIATEDVFTPFLTPIVDAGAVQILLGGAAGLSSTGSQFWTQASPGVADSPEFYDRFGTSLASGDLNGDGIDELIVGIPNEDGPNKDDDVTHIGAGAVAILRGTAAGLVAGRGFDVLSLRGESYSTVELFGNAIATGDIDGDGRDELAIGAPLDNTAASPSTSNAGAVYVLRGASGTALVDFTTFTKLLPNSPGFVIEQPNLSTFGWSLSMADFNGDGFADLAIGAPQARVGNLNKLGATHMIAGGPGGLNFSQVQLFTQFTPGMSNSRAASDQQGETLAAADFDGDGRAELALGARFANPINVVDAGTVTLLEGNPLGLRTNRNLTFFQGDFMLPDSAETNDGLGTAMAAGDFDLDGINDLAIGVPLEDLNGHTDTGVVVILYSGR